jgi:hypothetical protein
LSAIRQLTKANRDTTSNMQPFRFLRCMSRKESSRRNGCVISKRPGATSERGERYDGETFVEGLPRSTLRDFTHKLSIVPAGQEFRGWQKPRALLRVTFFYIDPRGPLVDPALRFGEIELKPRLFVCDRDLFETALKLKSQVENSGSMPRLTPLLRNISVCYGADRRPDPVPIDTALELWTEHLFWIVRR